MFNANLKKLRKAKGLSQEQVAERLNVSRQAVAKWENGESLPDIYNCQALAELYDITVDSLLGTITNSGKADIRPKGKHIFGAVSVKKNGMIKLPKKALEVFDISEKDLLLVLGDEEQGGLALCKVSFFMNMMKSVAASVNNPDADIDSEPFSEMDDAEWIKQMKISIDSFSEESEDK
ncbi:MAG: helix-turn-helix transcriptional regulator [Huintestinicola sp.]